MHDKSPETLQVTSRTFEAGGTIPQTALFNGMGLTGGNRSPHLAWENVPEGTAGFAIICHDPDAPTGVGFFHWIVGGIPANVRELTEDAGAAGGTALPSGAVHGINDYGQACYGGPCPPPGDPPHHYEFTVYALREPVGVDAVTTGAKLRFLTRGNLLASGTLTGRFGR